MHRFTAFLQRWLDRNRLSIDDVSERWRLHANRRTIIILLVVGTAVGFLYQTAIRPPDSFPTRDLVTVEKGQSLSEIAKGLADDGVIRSPLLFRVIVTALGKQRQLHAGDYEFKQPEDLFTIARALAIGQYGLEPIRIRIPEGATAGEMESIFSSELQRFDPTVFLARARSMEGYLFPDTYFFLPNATADTVLSVMRENFDTHEATINGVLASSSHSLSDIVIMASILEREARTMEDRRIIAGVLWRRLSIGMPLQADATFFYTMPRRTAITKKVLAEDTPYNTYLHTGLPPTPIGSPSLSSLEAAATPIDKGYLFYLADSAGVTHYSKTYAGQLANERLYLGH